MKLGEPRPKGAGKFQPAGLGGIHTLIFANKYAKMYNKLEE